MCFIRHDNDININQPRLEYNTWYLVLFDPFCYCEKYPTLIPRNVSAKWWGRGQTKVGIFHIVPGEL